MLDGVVTVRRCSQRDGQDHKLPVNFKDAVCNKLGNQIIVRVPYIKVDDYPHNIMPFLSLIRSLNRSMRPRTGTSLSSLQFLAMTRKYGTGVAAVS